MLQFPLRLYISPALFIIIRLENWCREPSFNLIMQTRGLSYLKGLGVEQFEEVTLELGGKGVTIIKINTLASWHNVSR